MKHDHSDATKKEIEYIYLVHGVIPEFVPHTAFRQAKHFQTSGRKIIRCPYCRSAFTTVDVDDSVELYRFATKSSQYHTIMPCRNCKRDVGVVFCP